LILPLPPSVNNCFATNFKTKRRFKSKAYTKWIKASLKAVQGQTLPYWHNGSLKIEIGIAKPLNKDGTVTKRKMDLDNRVKPIFDLMTELQVWRDDSQVDHLTVYWDRSKTFEGVKVKIKEVLR
jgi:Holliday junction resolvase RusA-like endonuclease|tara:strand:+ start:129 stop:500 length:372 start_codon:yes stop_codon:yes gene_type:complete